jgi:FKBP-type peptidyl-prolyl cis-trans isomerase FkpA
MRKSGVAAVVLALATFLTACDNTETGPSDTASFSSADVRAGSGPEATLGKSATVNYTGWLYAPTAIDSKGTQFDKGTFTFAVGTTQIIPGFSSGVVGMKVGGVRRMIVPPSQAYGANGLPPAIPPNATLLFEVELLAVQ